MEPLATRLGIFWSALAVGVFLGVSLLFATPATAGSAKVVICHIPPGDPGNAHTITVSEKSVPAHLKHGDWLGECASGCLNQADCDDQDLCTDDECLPDGTCFYASVDCDDSDVCTDDLCDSLEGCFYRPVSVTTYCDDNNVCTSDDTCDAGVCTGTDIPNCCLDASECDDGDWCTEEDACVNNVCEYSARDCSIPDDQCSVGSCDSLASECVDAPVSCEDTDVCTEDLCQPSIGCYNPPTANPPEPGVELTCDDGIDNDCDGLLDSADLNCAGIDCNATYPGLVYGGYDYAGRTDWDNLSTFIDTVVVPACMQDVLDKGCPADGYPLEHACWLPLGGAADRFACENCLVGPLTTEPCQLCYERRSLQISILCEDFRPITLDVCECTATETVEFSCDDGVDNDCDGLVDSEDGDCEPGCVPSEEICDGVDNDCNGVVDDWEPAAASCDDANACTGQYCFNGACVVDEDEWVCGEPRVFDCSPGVDPPCSTKEDLTGSDLTLAELAEEDLSGVDFTGSIFLNANLERANLMDAILASCTFQGANLNWANLSGADVSYATFSGADLGGASLIFATVEGTDFSTADLSSADLTALDLSGLNFSGADLGGARLEYANLGGADLNAADLNAAHLANANLSVADLREASLINADLSYSDLSGAALEDANFQRANLEGATLRNLDLSGYAGWTDFTDARLVDVDAVGSNFNGANFWNADLSGSNFSGASLLVRLINAVLLDAVLVGADLSGSDLRAADLSTADLSGANLEFASYNTDTKFPPLFDPVAAGMTEVSCFRTEVYEESCRDGLDNDCNGHVDSEDAYCGR